MRKMYSICQVCKLRVNSKMLVVQLVTFKVSGLWCVCLTYLVLICTKVTSDTTTSTLTVGLQHNKENHLFQ